MVIAQSDILHFETWLLSQGYAQKTIEYAIECIKYFPFTELTSDTVCQYVVSLKKANYKASSINRILAGLKLWMKYYKIEDNTNFFKIKRQSTRQILTDDEIERFLSIESEPLVDTFRNLETINNLYFPIGNGLHPIGNGEWGFEFRSRLRKTGIQRKGLSVYSFRHSYITEMVGEVDIFALMTLVGHRKATTTQKYYHSNLKRLRMASEKYPLIEKTKEEQFSTVVDALKNTLSGFATSDYRLVIDKKNKKYHPEVVT